MRTRFSTSLRVTSVGFVFALLTGCLEGDPNPLGEQQNASSSGIGSSGQSTPSPAPTVQPSNVCSKSSAQAVNLPFRNNFKDQSVTLFWVNYECREIQYAVLPAGQTSVQQTFVSHPWRVRDTSTTALYKEFVPTTTAPPEVAVP